VCAQFNSSVELNRFAVAIMRSSTINLTIDMPSLKPLTRPRFEVADIFRQHDSDSRAAHRRSKVWRFENGIGGVDAALHVGIVTVERFFPNI